MSPSGFSALFCRFFLFCFCGREPLRLFAPRRAFLYIISTLAISHNAPTLARPRRVPSCFAAAAICVAFDWADMRGHVYHPKAICSPDLPSVATPYQIRATDSKRRILCVVVFRLLIIREIGSFIWPFRNFASTTWKEHLLGLCPCRARGVSSQSPPPPMRQRENGCRVLALLPVRTLLFS